MIDFALFFVWTYEAVGAWDGIKTIAAQVAEASLVDTALSAASGELTDGPLIPAGLTQLDPEVIARQLELHGIGLPQEWTLANFADQAA